MVEVWNIFSEIHNPKSALESVEEAEFSAGEEGLAEGGEGKALGFLLAFGGVLGRPCLDRFWEAHPKGADRGKFVLGRAAAEGEHVGVGQSLERFALEFTDALGKGVGEFERLGIVHEEQALRGDVGGVATAVDEARIREVEHG